MSAVQAAAAASQPADPAPPKFLKVVGEAAERQLTACIAGLLAGWSALFAALWFGALLAVGGAIVGLLGAVIGFHGIGQASQGFDILGAFGGLAAGFAVGFTLLFGTSLFAAPLHVLLAVVVGAALAVGITRAAVELEPLSLDLRSYRMPSGRALEAGVVAALAKMVRELGLPSSPKLRIADTPLPGAWTHTGTIVVTKGLIDTLNRQELEAVLAHELHHWHSGDAIGLRFVWACAFPIVLLCDVRTLVAEWRPWGALINILLWPAPVLMNWLVAPLMVARGRTLEFEADAAAIAAGWGTHLAEALKKLQDFEVARTGWEAALMRTHPPTEFRLEAIEKAVPEAAAATEASQANETSTKALTVAATPVAAAAPAQFGAVAIAPPAWPPPSPPTIEAQFSDATNELDPSP
jgi:Zn-dependent protease with chaperone function